jgi:nucleoside-diphosphate-sugar epimerase
MDTDQRVVLVTGAAGFIGSQVCRLLRAQGHAIVVVDRQFAAPQPYPQLSGDITDAVFLTQAMQSHAIDTIIHLAGLLNSASRRQPEEAMRVNIGASLALLRLAAESGVKRFIYGSSISAYGAMPCATYGAVSEQQPAAPENVYGVAKRYVELVGQDYHQRGAFEFVALRIAMVVGAGEPNQSSPWRSQLFEQLRARQPVRIDLPFAPADVLPLVQVTDVAAAIAQLVSAGRPAYTIYNTPAERWTAGELAAYLHELNPNVEVAYNQVLARGDPEVIDGRRFASEFDFHPAELRNSLRQYAASQGVTYVHA